MWSCWQAKCFIRGPIAEDQKHSPEHILMLCPGPQSAARNKKQNKHKPPPPPTTTNKKGGGGGGHTGVVYWSLDTLEMKAPLEGARSHVAVLTEVSVNAVLMTRISGISHVTKRLTESLVCLVFAFWCGRVCVCVYLRERVRACVV